MRGVALGHVVPANFNHRPDGVADVAVIPPGATESCVPNLPIEQHITNLPVLRRGLPGVKNDVVQHIPIRILNDLIIIEHLKGEVVAIAFDNGHFRKLAPTE
jgi:hypothetical protein